MSFSSSSLQSILVLSDPRRDTQVSLYFYVSGWSWVLCLGRKAWKGSGLKEIGSEVSHVQFQGG